ncbi:MAG TPA: hypothetical protein VFO83_07580 [Aggregicoccus sp.]|nr:hypothetical protein [Aggregicoccus sp.]
MKHRRLPPWFLALLLMLLGSAAPALAADEEMPVPAKFQAVLFKRIFAYERTLKTLPQVRVLLASESSAASELQRELEAVGVAAHTLAPEDARVQLSPGTVLYLFPDSPAALRKLALERKVLCISGYPALVLAGQASVGVDKKADGKPQILVHLKRLKAEGHELSSDVLRLARVVP